MDPKLSIRNLWTFYVIWSVLVFRSLLLHQNVCLKRLQRQVCSRGRGRQSGNWHPWILGRKRAWRSRRGRGRRRRWTQKGSGRRGSPSRKTRRSGKRCRWKWTWLRRSCSAGRKMMNCLSPPETRARFLSTISWDSGLSNGLCGFVFFIGNCCCWSHENCFLKCWVQ